MKRFLNRLLLLKNTNKSVFMTRIVPETVSKAKMSFLIHEIIPKIFESVFKMVLWMIQSAQLSICSDKELLLLPNLSHFIDLLTKK